MSLTRGNQVIVWNSVALQMIRNVQSPPPDSARQLAIVAVSVFDAVNAIHPRYASYDIAVKAPRPASADAAAASAAYTALVGLFPSEKPILDAELATSLSAIPGGRPKAQGIALGTSVATQILALRANDGSTTKVVYNPTPGPGVWVPTPPKYAPPIDPQWGQVTPFALTSGGQFQPPPPPAITSPEYAAAYNQVEAIGGTNSTTRTADQTAIAAFWSDQTGHTFDPPGHWNQIAEIVAAGQEHQSRELGPDIRLAEHGTRRRRNRVVEREVHVQHLAAGDGDPRGRCRPQPPGHGRSHLDVALAHAAVPVLRLGP